MSILGERIKQLRGKTAQKNFAQFLGIPLTTFANKEKCWELAAENRQLHREKEEFLRENGELKAMVARLEEGKNRLCCYGSAYGK